MKLILVCFALCLLALSAAQAFTMSTTEVEEYNRLGELQARRALAAKNKKKKAKTQTIQFQMVAEPRMCAAGKSSWVDATGAGPLHLEACLNNRGKRNANTLFTVAPSNSQPGMKVLRRQNSKKKNFCLHNFGGGFAVLSMISPCAPGLEEDWNLSTDRQVSWTQSAEQCWDTLGNFFLNTRIGLQACDSNSLSQRFKKIVVKK